MADVVDFGGTTKLDINPQRIIEGLEGQNFTHILVLGWIDDDEHYFASNTGKKGELLLLIEEFKHRLIAGDYD